MCMHLTESHMYALKDDTHVFYIIAHVCVQQNHTCMHLTESHVYAFNRITCMHLTESHVYAFNRITKVCI